MAPIKAATAAFFALGINAAGATCVLNDAQDAQTQALDQCRAIYAQARFDKLPPEGKDRAISACAVAHTYYKLPDKKS